MKFNKDKIIILLGAGASVEAGIPSSMMMIKDIESLIAGETIDNDHKIDWRKYKGLYSLIKSSIIHSYGLNNNFGDKASYNIEKLVDTLSELEKHEQHILFPFISEWDKRLIKYAGENFSIIKDMKRDIENKLKIWVTIDHYEEASYYASLIDFHKEWTHPLRIFSLNYDICLEKHRGTAILETGFENKKWTWTKFAETGLSEVNLYLYKMHGSIDWQRDQEGNLTFSEEIVKVKSPELIFGTRYKMQYTDPYLFFTTEFRKFTLDAQLIITIGYGFGDEHINGMLSQALRSNSKTQMLCASLYPDKKHILRELNPIQQNQVTIKDSSAKEFLQTELKIEKLEKLLPPEEDIFKL